MLRGQEPGTRNCAIAVHQLLVLSCARVLTPMTQTLAGKSAADGSVWYSEVTRSPITVRLQCSVGSSKKTSELRWGADRGPRPTLRTVWLRLQVQLYWQSRTMQNCKSTRTQILHWLLSVGHPSICNDLALGKAARCCLPPKKFSQVITCTVDTDRGKKCWFFTSLNLAN